MNSWIKKENKDREKPRTNWKKHDDGRNRNNKAEFTEVRAKHSSGIASVVVIGEMNVEKFYDEMKKSSFSWLENSLI
jgi:hypothetical protein